MGFQHDDPKLRRYSPTCLAEEWSQVEETILITHLAMQYYYISFAAGGLCMIQTADISVKNNKTPIGFRVNDFYKVAKLYFVDSHTCSSNHNKKRP